MSQTRKEFLGTIAKGAVALAGLSALGACADDVAPSIDAAHGNPDSAAGTADATPGIDAAPPDCAANGTLSTISANHGHVITVSKADVAAGVDKTYDITGTAAHMHSVTFTAADFALLQGNTMTMEVSTVGGAHTHTVTIRCA